MKKIVTKKNKNLYVYLGNGRAFNMQKKDITATSNGVVAVKTMDGMLHVFTTKNQKEIALCLGNESGVKPIEFNDNQLNCNWELLYGFLFDQDSSVLFFAERKAAVQMGVFKSFADGYDLAGQKKVAFHLAGFISSEFQETVMALDDDNEDSLADDFSFLLEEGSGSYEV